MFWFGLIFAFFSVKFKNNYDSCLESRILCLKSNKISHVAMVFLGGVSSLQFLFHHCSSLAISGWRCCMPKRSQAWPAPPTVDSYSNSLRARRGWCGVSKMVIHHSEHRQRFEMTRSRIIRHAIGILKCGLLSLYFCLWANYSVALDFCIYPSGVVGQVFHTSRFPLSCCETPPLHPTPRWKYWYDFDSSPMKLYNATADQVGVPSGSIPCPWSNVRNMQLREQTTHAGTSQRTHLNHFIVVEMESRFLCWFCTTNFGSCCRVWHAVR
jgi:hypothetical protein